MNIKPLLSQVIEYQKDAHIQYFCGGPSSKEKQYLRKQFDKKWRLSDVSIDISGVLLGLCKDTNQDLGVPKDSRFVLLHELVHMPGHITAFHMDSGQIFSGVHDNNFNILRPELDI